MKKWWIAGIAVGLLAAVVVGMFYFTRGTSRVKLTIGDASFAMRVARTDAEREQGLSGTSALPADDALLFTFDSDSEWGIWMKDMNYPIDIVWLNSAKKVTYVVKNARPDSYPDTIYEPNKPSRYVIELKAGVAEAKRITIGKQAVFDSTKGSFE